MPVDPQILVDIHRDSQIKPLTGMEGGLAERSQGSAEQVHNKRRSNLEQVMMNNLDFNITYTIAHSPKSV